MTRRIAVALLLAAACTALAWWPRPEPDPWLEAVARQGRFHGLWERLTWRAASRHASPCALLDHPWTAPLARAGWSPLLLDDFEGHGLADWSLEGASHGSQLGGAQWRTRFHGCSGPCAESEGVRVIATDADDEPTRALSLRPSPPGDAGTRASLLVSEASASDFVLSLERRTVESTRTTAPNNWESAWVFFRYGQGAPSDADPGDLCRSQRTLYFALKPGFGGGDGWELGKFGPGYAPRDGITGDCQRFLASGDHPREQRGAWQHVCLAAAGPELAVWVDGERLRWQGRLAIADGDDRAGLPALPGEPVYQRGAVGLYTEDAEAHFDDVVLFGRP